MVESVMIAVSIPSTPSLIEGSSRLGQLNIVSTILAGFGYDFTTTSQIEITTVTSTTPIAVSTSYLTLQEIGSNIFLGLAFPYSLTVSAYINSGILPLGAFLSVAAVMTYFGYIPTMIGIPTVTVLSILFLGSVLGRSKA